MKHDATNHSTFRSYRRRQSAELRPYVAGESLDGISLTDVNRQEGSPKAGDMIARNPKDPRDQWLVSAAYFAENYDPVPLDDKP